MSAEISGVIAQFEANPVLGAKSMRTLLDENPQRFFAEALPLLRVCDETHGFQYLLTVLITQGWLQRALCNPDLFTFEEAMRLARRVVQVDPQFDAKLLRALLQKNGSTPADELERIAGSEAGVRLLAILGEISDGTRILPTMAQLLNHSDPRVRSKAALLVGRSNKNHRWVEDKLNEPDPRVRANAIQALWGADTPGARTVFLNALNDRDSRVIGNAVLGLYRHGDPEGIRRAMQLLAHPDPDFRIAAVWAMGETGDARFLPIVGRLIGDPQPELRTCAFKALAKLKAAAAKRALLPPAGVFLGPVHRGQDGWTELFAVVRPHAGLSMGEIGRASCREKG